MATPFDYLVADQVRLTAQWHSFLAKAKQPDDPLCALAQEAVTLLDKRNYGKLPPGAVKGAKTEAEVGAELRATFEAAVVNTQDHEQARATAESAFKKVGAPARARLRRLRRSVAAVARGEAEPALAGLPLLGEISNPEKLFASAAVLIAFLRKKPVQALLLKYNITAAEVSEVETTVAAAHTWWTAATSAKEARPVVIGDTVKARDKAVAWLAKWWSLARDVLGDRPDLLKLLGVVEHTRRRPGANKATEPGVPLGTGTSDAAENEPTGVEDPGSDLPPESDVG